MCDIEVQRDGSKVIPNKRNCYKSVHNFKGQLSKMLKGETCETLKLFGFDGQGSYLNLCGNFS